MKKNCFCTLFLLLFSILARNVWGQTPNTYKFIEPNISISYDSNLFKISERYSNSFYETEAYDFTYQADTLNRVRIHLEANQVGEHQPMSVVDSKMLSGIKELKTMDNDSIKVVSVDESPRHIQGFSLLGFVGYDKVNKQYGTLITGYHFSDNDKTEIQYSSNNRNDLVKEYEILKTFLSDFKSYSKEQISEEDAVIKSKYTVLVRPTKTQIDNFRFRKKTYLGIVSVKQPLQHQVAEVRLKTSLGEEIFSPDDHGQVMIMCLDEKKGTIVKKGELVVLNSFGKQLKLPFTFSYVNNGAW